MTLKKIFKLKKIIKKYECVKLNKIKQQLLNDVNGNTYAQIAQLKKEIQSCYFYSFKIRQLKNELNNKRSILIRLLPLFVKLKKIIKHYMKKTQLNMINRINRRLLLRRKMKQNPKKALRILKNKNKKLFFTRHYNIQRKEFELMRKFKYSVINFKKKYRLRKEIEMGKRMHPLYNDKLNRRIVFFRVSSQGQK